MFFFKQLILLCTIFVCLESAGPPNPCPNVFDYQFNGTKWQGVIKINDIQSAIKTIKLNVDLSIATILPSKYSGEIRLIHPNESLFHNLKDRGVLNYKVLFPVTFPLPVVTEITLNNVRICSGPPVTGSFVTSISLEHTLFLESQTLSTNHFFNQFPPKTGLKTGPRALSPPFPAPTTLSPPQLNNFPSIRFQPAPTDEPSIDFGGKFKIGPYEDVCGVPALTKPLVVRGAPSNRKAHPWHAALFVKTDLGISFMCGGNLISDRHVLTAAHCIRLGSEGHPISPDDFLIMLGKYNIKKYGEPGSIISEISHINIHPDNNLDTADADLALLTLSEHVNFNSVVKPICIYQTPQSLDRLVGKIGTIAGWGRDENGNKMTNQIQETQIMVVSQETCLRSHMAFKDITSKRTFCAGGIREGTGPCTGDSGGGLIIQENGKWYLRGIISRSLVEKGNSLGCDTFSFSVFVDVTKFTGWINSFIS